MLAGFTDDTVLTVAVANSILHGVDFADSIKSFAQEHCSLPYGRSFKRWMWSWENKPYNSFGNGSAMRVSPVGFAFESIHEVLEVAKRSAEVSHNHPEGIKARRWSDVWRQPASGRTNETGPNMDRIHNLMQCLPQRTE